MPEQLDNSFDPTALPLGSIAACDVSDQPTWTCVENDCPGDESKYVLSTAQRDGLSAMVKAVSSAETQARRWEVELAWKLRLMDRGFHYIYPMQNGGWSLVNPNQSNKSESPWASSDRKSQWPLNLIGCANDTIVTSLTRELPRCEFFPAMPEDDVCITAADAKNKYKIFLANQNNYQERAQEMARFFCTDDRVAVLMRPVADAQTFGYEDGGDDIVPETEDDGMAEAPTKRPKIREVLDVFGKLEHKTQIIVSGQGKSPYEQIYQELDVSLVRGMLPWIADKITGGDVGIAEVQLDRMARCSIKLALRGTYSTGDSLIRDTTLQRTWLRPAMYLDDSCPKTLRPWMFETFPKGVLVVYAGKQFGYARNEGVDEVLTVVHGRSGSGQNRRALTEAYMGPNLRLNNWQELMNKYFVNGIPRTYLNENVFSIAAIKAQESQPHAVDGFNPDKAGVTDPNMLGFTPQMSQMPAGLPDAISYYAGEVKDMLTGAPPALSGVTDENDPDTFGQEKMRNSQAMGKLGEPYQAIREALRSATDQGTSWAARVQPEDKELDNMIGGKRLKVKIAEMKGDTVCVVEGDANIPESWEERKAFWAMMIASVSQNPNSPYAPIVMNPLNAARFKQFYPPDTVIPGVDAVEKQEGEFELLLEQAPLPNPQYLQLKMLVDQGQAEAQALNGAMEPEKVQLLEQMEQELQQIPQQISSVSILPKDNDAIEAMTCNAKINSPEGRKLGRSKRTQDQQVYQNLVLHCQEHEKRAKAQAMANQQPIPPKTSISIAADKLPPTAQSAALAKAGIATPPDQLDGAMQPHESKIEQEHIDPFTGGKTKITQAVMNPEH